MARIDMSPLSPEQRSRLIELNSMIAIGHWSMDAPKIWLEMERMIWEGDTRNIDGLWLQAKHKLKIKTLHTYL
jgi:hypothetical protein